MNMFNKKVIVQSNEEIVELSNEDIDMVSGGIAPVLMVIAWGVGGCIAIGVHYYLEH